MVLCTFAFQISTRKLEQTIEERKSLMILVLRLANLYNFYELDKVSRKKLLVLRSSTLNSNVQDNLRLMIVLCGLRKPLYPCFAADASRCAET